MKIKTYDPKERSSTLFVKSLAGFEEHLAAELLEITGHKAHPARRGVSITTDREGLYKICYQSRLAQKVLVPLASFKAKNPDHLYEQSLQLPWAEWMDVDETYAFQSTVHSEAFEHSQFAMQRMRDGLNDQFRKKLNKRPSVDTEMPSRAFHLHIDRDQVNLSLDATGLPLHKRGYRKHGAGAPLSEVLAASIVAATGWDGKTPFYDLMCGSGTLSIEAAMRAANVPSQLMREHFAFEEWPWHDKGLWRKVRKEADAKIDTSNMPLIVGGDIVPNNVHISESNAEDLPIAGNIQWEAGDFLETKPHKEEGLLVLNPPYGGRLGKELQVISLYNEMGTALKHNWGGHHAWIISSNFAAIKRIGLRPSKKMQVFNGALECRLMQFELFKGKRAEHLEAKKK